MKFHVQPCILMAAALLALVPLGGRAQAGPALDTEVDGTATYTAESRVAGGPARLRLNEYNVEVGNDAASIGVDEMEFNWERLDRTMLPNHATSAWARLYSVNLDLAALKRVAPAWSVFAGSSIIIAFEDEPAKAPNAELAAGAQIDFTPTLSLRAGPLAFLQPADSMVLPLVSLDWSESIATNALWKLSLGFPESHGRYELSRRTALLLDLVFYGTLYHLAGDSAISKNGYVETEYTTASLAVDTLLVRNLHLAVGASRMFGRSFTFFDRGGDRNGSLNVSDAFGGFAELRYAL